MKIEKRVVGVVMLGALAMLAGCSKESGAAGAASSSAAPTGSATAPATTTATATTAAAPPAEKITPSKKAPFETLMFKETPTKNDKGWPKFDMYNLGDKTVGFAALYGYAYDASGKLVARTETPLSWNGKLAAGEKSTWAVEVGRSEKAPLPATAVAFEICYDSISYDGDAKSTSDTKRCTATRAKGSK